MRSTTAATGARARGLRVHLIALVVVAILPISLFAVATVLIERKQQRELSEASLGARRHPGASTTGCYSSR